MSPPRWAWRAGVIGIFVELPRQRNEASALQHPETDAMHGFVADIERMAQENSDFRRVLYTGSNLQLVLMAIAPGGAIGEEVHDDGDQFFRVESGMGEVVIDGHRAQIKGGDAVVVPAGARHNIVNVTDKPLHLYTVYGPPAHRDGTVHATEAVAKASNEHFDGKTTE